MSKPWENPELIRDAEHRMVTSISPTVCFTNDGFAYIKRTTVVKGDEVPTIDVLPITTARVDVIRTSFSRDRLPKPPTKDKFIHHESEEGKALGLTKSQVVTIPDYADEDYRHQMMEWTEKFNWSLAAEAINVDMMYQPAGVAELRKPGNTEEKIQALKQAGFKNAQIESIAADVLRISNFTEEERRNFFGAN